MRRLRNELSGVTGAALFGSDITPRSMLSASAHCCSLNFNDEHTLPRCCSHKARFKICVATQLSPEDKRRDRVKHKEMHECYPESSLLISFWLVAWVDTLLTRFGMIEQIADFKEVPWTVAQKFKTYKADNIKQITITYRYQKKNKKQNT